MHETYLNLRRFAIFAFLSGGFLLGCLDGHTQANEPNSIPSFNGDVAKVFHSKCASCHRPGQSGPFSLLTYDDVAERADTIWAVIDDGYMPPWKLVNNNLSYSHDRRLTEEEVRLVKGWVEGGKPLGDPKTKVEMPTFPKDWQLGKPDMEIEMEGSFAVPEAGPDVYRSFLFKVKLPEDKWVKAIEIRPQAKSTLHHALFFVDTTGESRSRDGQNGKAGFSGMNFFSQLNPAARRGRGGGASIQGLGGYVPGTTPAMLPGDLAMLLPKNSDIVMQTHFHPSGKPEVEHATLALYFAEKPPSRLITNVQLPPLFGRLAGIKVPAGEDNYEISDSFVLPVDVEGVVISGHAHYICKKMQMTARTPSNELITLMQIDDWDLDWQDSYQFAKSVDLPVGTELSVRITYDNSADNPENPFDPPQTIAWGRESTDEMGSVTLRVVPKDAKDQDELQRGYRNHVLKSFSSSNRTANRGGIRITMSTFLQMRALDKNRDYKISREEVPAKFRSRFKTFDVDASGFLERDEFTEAVELIRSSQ